jgi:hypothetical protein
VPSAPTDAPDDLQETPNNLQETHDDTQDNSQVGNEMTFLWRDLSYDEDGNAHLIDHFCRRGTSDKDPTKPARSVLLQLLLKEKVASGELVIDGFEEGIPILIRGRAHVSEDIDRAPEEATTTTATPTATPLQEASQPLQYLRQSQSQLQPHAQATPTQLAMEDARLAKVAYAKATRIAQERTQEAAQEANRIKQDATADSRKAKKEDRYRAAIEKLGKLPPCPKLCRGEECSGIPCEEEEPGLTYEHLHNMVVCQDKAYLSMATKDRCLLFHLWPPRKRSPKPPAGPPAGHPAKNRQPAKNLGGGTSGARQAPKNNGNPRQGSHVRQERGPSNSSSSLGSSSKAASPTRGPSRG